jgi:hypothetical protein
MRPAAGSSLRIVLVNKADSSRLLVFMHLAIGDSRSVVLLCEDLFRIYQQLAHGKKVALPRAGKTYTAFMSEFEPRQDNHTSNPGEAVAQDVKTSVTAVSIDKKLASEITSPALRKSGVLPATVMFAGLLRSLARMDLDVCLGFDARIDHRLADSGLEKTVGALTGTYRVPQQIIQQAGNLRQLQQSIQQLPIVADAHDELAQESERLLINLEYLINEPWLEGEEWHSEGFLIDEQTLPASYILDVVPIASRDMKVLVRSRGETGARLAARISNHLTGELAKIAEQCKAFAAAHDFCLTEFKNHDGKPNLQTRDHDESYSTVALTVDQIQKHVLEADCDTAASSIVLAAYSLLVSRLNGRDEVTLAACMQDAGNAVPIRLRISDELSFAEFVKLIEQKSARAVRQGSAALEVLKSVNSVSPCFDVGIVFSEAERALETRFTLEQKLEEYQGVEQPLALLLECSDETDLNLRLNCRTNLFGEHSEEKLAGYLKAIFNQAFQNVAITLNEITLDEHAAETMTVETLAGATFNFS